MSYLPLARKYRPQTFDDLIGQPHVTATLTKALAGRRVASAYLFAGQRGVGKTSAARILAKCLNCERGPSPKPCNRCASCEQIAQGNSLDTIEIDGASNRGIDEIRTLRETVPFAPTTGQFRVYIIDEVHMLTTEAFNALLKTLEEPPAHVRFIFATTNPSKLPATILSRCQRFDFRRIEAGALVEALSRIAKAEQLHVEQPALYAIARASSGSLRDAEVVLEQLSSFASGAIKESDVAELLGAVESEALMAWAQAILQGDTAQTLQLLAQQVERGRDATQLLNGLAWHFRNLLMVASTASAPGRNGLLARLVDEPPEQLKRLEEQAKGLSAQELVMLLQLVAGAHELIRRSPMAQTILELVLIKLATRERWQSLDQISQRLEQLQRGEEGDPAAGPGPAQAPTAAQRADQVAAVLSSAPAASRGEQPAPLEAKAPESIKAAWPVFLERLGKQKMSLAAYLAEAMPVGLEGGTVTIGLPAFALHQEVLSIVEHQRLIERLLGELCQMKVTVAYTTLAVTEPPGGSATQAEATERVPPVVQDIVDLFNATILNKPQQAT